MKSSRRAFLLAAPALWLGGASIARAETYQYDALGRLVRVTFSDGHIVQYAYDAAGNRIELARTDGSAFNQTIQITGTGPVNLRTLANAAGYPGLNNATITFQIGSAVTITGTPGSTSVNGGNTIDTGLWPSSTYAIALTLQVSGKVYGGGGGGGYGASGSNGSLVPGSAGKAGGDAIYARENMTVVVNSGGQVKSGGGGGGGGGAWLRSYTDGEGQPAFDYYEGGGGGGGFANGGGGSGVNSGSVGTTSGGGSGGAGVSAGGSRVSGAGGAGGAAGASGASGANPTGSGPASWSTISPGAGGAAGYAVRKNGKTVTVTNNGTISGTVG